ncbi:MAG: hypothetical protein H6551_02565 [Chitinophagales bacterium]|nr:hypothetical protein [Chitinophagaceae bacterium]MCB9064005.1 hypothetical protein [Chitinophagales bacterium]
MKNLFLFAALLLLLSSCQDEPNTQEPTKVVLSEAEEMARLNDYMAKYKTPPQTFTISSDKPQTITGDKGSKWHIDPANLETQNGQPVTDDITVALIELSNTADFLKNDIQTVTDDGRILVSGGSYYIGMSAGGNSLKLKEGKSIKAELPKMTDEDMELFYGSRDDKEVMSWEETGKDFKTAFEVVKEEKKSKDTAWMTIDRPKKIAGNVRPGAWRDPRKIREEEAIDSMMSYVNGHALTGDDKEKNHNVQQARKIYKNIYQAIEIEELGWLNVDKYLQSEIAAINILTDGIDTNSFTKIYAIFKDINGIVQNDFFGNSHTFERLPKNTDMKLIAYAFSNNKIFFDTKELVIENNYQDVAFTFREATDDDINAFFQ